MPSNSRSLALLLGLLLLGLSALCDWFSQAPQLAPPLLISAVVSALLCAWGVPQLRRLKLKLLIVQRCWRLMPSTPVQRCQ